MHALALAQSCLTGIARPISSERDEGMEASYGSVYYYINYISKDSMYLKSKPQSLLFLIFLVSFIR